MGCAVRKAGMKKSSVRINTLIRRDYTVRECIADGAAANPRGSGRSDSNESASSLLSYDRVVIIQREFLSGWIK